MTIKERKKRTPMIIATTKTEFVGEGSPSVEFEVGGFIDIVECS